MHATTPRTPRAGRRESINASTALTVPSRAFTGRPRASTIDFGSAKNERYKSHGTSAIKSGAATGPGYALAGPGERARGEGAAEAGAQALSIQQFSLHRKRFGPLS